MKNFSKNHANVWIFIGNDRKNDEMLFCDGSKNLLANVVKYGIFCNGITVKLTEVL